MEGGIVLRQVAGFDVSVTGLGARRLNAQHHHIVSGRGHGDAFLQGLQESRLVGDHMVGGKNPQHRVGVLALDEERGQPAGRRGVAGHRLLHNLRRRAAGQLVGDLLRQILVGDDPGFLHPGQRLEALHGLLNHGALAVQSQNLLGAGAARAGPEAGSAAASQNHRTKIDRRSTWKKHPTRQR